jgi:hypothetical protein
MVSEPWMGLWTKISKTTPCKVAWSGLLNDPAKIFGQITGISSSSQELSPRRKIRRGLFESDDTLSGHTLPSAQKVAAAANRIG